MSVYAGPADWWTDRTNIGRTHIATKGVVQTGLVLNLDSGVSSSYAGSGSTWTDLSGNGNHGTLTFGPTYSSSNGGEIVFDGVNDYVSFNNLTTSSLGLTSSNGATLSCWLKITLLSRWTGVLVFSNLNTVDIGWDITPSNVLRIWKNSAQVGTSSLSSYSNIWCQYTLISNSSGTIFYINGNQFATTSTTGDVTFNSGRNLTFCDHWDNPVQGSGAILQIYNRALTAAQVSQNFNALRGRFGI